MNRSVAMWILAAIYAVILVAAAAEGDVDAFIGNALGTALVLGVFAVPIWFVTAPKESRARTAPDGDSSLPAPPQQDMGTVLAPPPLRREPSP